MDMTVDQSTLARALRLVSRATPTRSTLPILQTVRLDAQPGRLILATTDLELGMTTSAVANVSDPSSVCVSARLLGGSVAQLPNEPVRLSLNPESHRLRLSCGRFVANVVTMDPASPVLASPESAPPRSNSSFRRGR